MTEAAKQFIGPLTLQSLSGHPVYDSLLDPEQENAMGHINLARWAEAIVIAPATANTLARMSHGLADDLLAALYLAAECPVYVAPAMNQAMWQKAVTQENLHRLRQQGVHIIGPDTGDQACGELGPGRMSEPQAICSILLPDRPQSMQERHVLISAGPTREALDPVRYLTNRSSGKMGYALANAALKAGAAVTLVSGPVHLSPPQDCEFISVESAQQMYESIMARASHVDIYIGAAAVADYRPAVEQDQKIKKQAREQVVVLQPTRDILASVAALDANRPFVVGFAAETDRLETYAQQKLRDKNLDMIAANLVGGTQGGFDSDDNALQVFWPDGERTFPMASKQTIAEQLIELVAQRLHEKNTTKNSG